MRWAEAEVSGQGRQGDTMNIDEQREAIRVGLAKGFYYKATGNSRWESRSDVVKAPHYKDADVILAFLTEKGAVLQTDLIKEVRLVGGTFDKLDNPFYDTAPLIEPKKPV